MEPSLTICSVYHSDAARRILEMNEVFVARMNPGSSWIRFAANNSPNESIHIQGSRIQEFPHGVVPSTAPPVGQEGYHYGAALNRMLPHVRTRFVLFLDYDFFIIRPNWISEILASMEKKNLALLGAPYRPKYWVKFRSFPVQYCLFVDREKIGSEFLAWDFMPQYSPEHLKQGDISEAWKQSYRARHRESPSWTRRMLENIKKRKYIGTSRDMSYDLFRRYGGAKKIQYECFESTAVLADFLTHYYVHKRWHPFLYWIEKLIPERLSFIPKQKGNFTLTSFKDRGVFDVLGLGMEEWWWQDAPFAFHVRGFKERHLKATGMAFDPEENIRAIQNILEHFS